MRFGEFLISRNLVSQAQLLHALDEQARNAPFAGTIAVQMGFLSPEQVLTITQRCQNENIEFLALSFRLGLLTEKQTALIMQNQSENTPKLGQIFVRQKVVNEEALAPLLREFFSLKASTPKGI